MRKGEGSQVFCRMDDKFLKTFLWGSHENNVESMLKFLEWMEKQFAWPTQNRKQMVKFLERMGVTFTRKFLSKRMNCKWKTIGKSGVTEK